MTDPIVYPGEAFGVRYGVGPFKWRSLVRGVLRALQFPEDPCTPVDPEDPSILESMTPYIVYPSEDTQLYEERFQNLDEKKKKGIPLPPRGGTWLMDEIKDPTQTGGPFTYSGPSNKKVLITGGGTVGTSPEGAYYNSTYEAGEDADTWTCPPRRFMVSKGKKSEVQEGWPWIEVRPDPEDAEKKIAFARLVKISAVFRLFNDGPAYHNFANFTIQFTRLDGTPFGPQDPARLDPIEFTVDHAVDYADDDFYGSILRYRFTGPDWYDFSLTSLTKRGNKAILGIHSTSFSSRLGCCCDFIVLDLEAEGGVEGKVTFYDRFSINPPDNVTADYSSSSGSVNAMRLTLHGPGDYDDIDPAQLQAYRVGYEVVPSSFPSGGSSADVRWGTSIIFLHFDAEERIVKTYFRYDISSGASTSHSTSVDAPYELSGQFPNVPRWQVDTFYPKNSVVCNQGILARWWVNYYRAKEDHTSNRENGPGLSDSSCLAVDRDGSAWEFFYGFRCSDENAKYQTWRDNWYTQGIPPLDHYRQSGSGSLRIGLGNDQTMGIFQYPMGAHAFSNIVDSTRSYSSTIRYSIRQDFLEDPPESTEELYYLSWISSSSGQTQRRETVAPYPIGLGWPDPTLVVSHQRASSGSGSSRSVTDVTGTVTSYSCPNSGNMPSTKSCFGRVQNYKQGSFILGIDDFWAAGARSFAGVMYYHALGNELGIGYIEGVGIALGITAGCAGSTSSGTCFGFSSSPPNYTTRVGHVVTFYSKKLYTGAKLLEGVGTASNIFRAKEDFDGILAATDPAVLSDHKDEEGVIINDGRMLEAVIGPEKGILCENQQISFIGALYGSELRETPSEE